MDDMYELGRYESIRIHGVVAQSKQLVIIASFDYARPRPCQTGRAHWNGSATDLLAVYFKLLQSYSSFCVGLSSSPDINKPPSGQRPHLSYSYCMPVK